MSFRRNEKKDWYYVKVLLGLHETSSINDLKI